MTLQICLTCHQFISLVDGVWVHDATGAAQCRMLQAPVASPAPASTGRWDGK